MAERGSSQQREYGLALLILLVGAAVALLISTRTWQTVLTPRPRPYHDDLLHLNGRAVDAAPTALALVALAGVIAVIATRGLMRRVIGLVLALAGALLIWRSLGALTAVSASRARTLIEDRHAGVSVGTAVPQVSVSPGWAWLSAGAGVLVLLAGLLIAWRGSQWSAMSAKYEPPSAQKPPTLQKPQTADDAAQAKARADASMWSALDRGDDPTRIDPH